MLRWGRGTQVSDLNQKLKAGSLRGALPLATLPASQDLTARPRSVPSRAAPIPPRGAALRRRGAPRRQAGASRPAAASLTDRYFGWLATRAPAGLDLRSNLARLRRRCERAAPAMPLLELPDNNPEGRTIAAAPWGAWCQGPRCHGCQDGQITLAASSELAGRWVRDNYSVAILRAAQGAGIAAMSISVDVAASSGRVSSLALGGTQAPTRGAAGARRRANRVESLSARAKAA